MSEVNDENQLDEDEEKASDHAEVHPHLAECSVRDPEGANHPTDDEQVFEAPEPVLDPGSAIINQNAGISDDQNFRSSLHTHVIISWVTCTKFPCKYVSKFLKG